MLRLAAFVAFVLLVSGSAMAQTTRPVNVQVIELRAMDAFENGDYARAMPLFIKVAQHVKDDPARLGSIQEKIRVCQRRLGGKEIAASGDAGAADAPVYAQRVPHVRPADGQVLELGIKELGNFDYDIEKGGMIPADVKELSGVKIRTRGYMIPIDQADRITQFVLVPSLLACCFGQPPGIQHTITVRAPKGKAVAYSPDPIIVEGSLRVEEMKEDGVIVSIFEMECTSAKPAPQ